MIDKLSIDVINVIRERCGYSVSAYDDEIESLIRDGIEDMVASGVTEAITDESGMITNDQYITALTLYVKAYIGDDRTDTDKYIELYQRKVFRLTL